MVESELVGALEDSARQVLADYCGSVKRHRLIDEQPGAFDRELWLTAGELGWLSVVAPEEFGGAGAGLPELGCLQREMGRALASLPFLATSLVARAISLWPHPALRDRLLPDIIAGRLIGGIVDMSELSNRSIMEVSTTRGRTLTGSYAAVLDGAAADILLVPIAMPGGMQGLAILEAALPGISTNAVPLADLTQRMATVKCSQVALAEDCLATGDDADELVQRLLDEAKVLIACDAIGGGEAALAATIEYLQVREQFGKPIGTFQALKHRCADHKVALEAAKRLTLHAIARSQTSQRGLLSALAKSHACDVYSEIAADCVQMHGGIGFTWEHDAHLFLKRAMFDQFLFGQSAVQQDRAGELLMQSQETA